MSTYWYLECLDHDPPLQSAEEISQHTDDEYHRRAVQLVNERPLDPEWENTYWQSGSASTYFEAHARRFLVDHPKCNVGFFNEYGERRTAGDKGHLLAALKVLEDEERRAIANVQRISDQKAEVRQAIVNLEKQ